MFGETSTTIEQLLDSLGFTLIRAVDDAVDLRAPVATIGIHDPLEPLPVAAGELIFGAGVTDDESASTLIKNAAAAGAAGVVLRDQLTTGSAVREAVRSTRLPVLDLVRGASWLQLASMIESQLTAAGAGDRGFGAAGADLFELANTIAALVGGPVTIEDLSSRILAYSSDQQEADLARQQTVLGQQVPAGYSERLSQDGVFSRIYGTDGPVYVASLGPEVLPRVAIRLAAGGEILGSIWAVAAETDAEDGPLTEQQRLGLVEAAGVVALSIMRNRMSTESARRQRAEEVITLLEGGPQAVQAARRAGFPDGPACVLAFGVDDQSGDAQRGVDRLAGSLQMYLAAAHPSVRTAVLGDVVYAVQPLSEDRGLQAAVQLAEDFVRRSATFASSPLVGIGRSAEDVETLACSRRDADATLRVLAEDRQRPRTRRLATADQVQAAILLIKVRDHLTESDDLDTGPLAALLAYDAAHDAGLVETLRAWLESFGDVNGASAELHIHKNTFRYRLRRLSEIADLDLADPDTRLGLMLQLRLVGDAATATG
ncbi:PucR family transcriptional regulator [Microlunatus soli]|uniref:DNA-binding transcriptional regulator, PucR family n=1 Tax=Microlunatus soli TaxID=630515 RepID=A0A1H1RHG1_9ACTN|nr:PucR family transcriptional regulator [Microlunatus soli]SDS35148.1 DNA-binding transcriptional regulator, PucR family [Microlunatus soli]